MKTKFVRVHFRVLLSLSRPRGLGLKWGGGREEEEEEGGGVNGWLEGRFVSESLHPCFLPTFRDAS